MSSVQEVVAIWVMEFPVSWLQKENMNQGKHINNSFIYIVVMEKPETKLNEVAVIERIPLLLMCLCDVVNCWAENRVHMLTVRSSLCPSSQSMR